MAQTRHRRWRPALGRGCRVDARPFVENASRSRSGLLGSRGARRAHRSAEHRRGALDPLVREADVPLVDGGDATYLCQWMRQSGLADLLPSLPDTVWVGLSAGSMVMAPRIGDDFMNWTPRTGGDSTPRGRRLRDLPARGSRAHAGQHHGRGGEVGRRHRGSGVLHRRPDRRQGDRRRRRGRLRGALEAVSLVVATTSARRDDHINPPSGHYSLNVTASSLVVYEQAHSPSPSSWNVNVIVCDRTFSGDFGLTRVAVTV